MGAGVVVSFILASLDQIKSKLLNSVCFVNKQLNYALGFSLFCSFLLYFVVGFSFIFLIDLNTFCIYFLSYIYFDIV